MTTQTTTLKRTLSLRSMVFYGLGTIVGAGIYVLIGEIAGEAGSWSPVAFLMAALIASFTGLSYAELVGRFPQSAGEAVYVDKAFHRQWLTQLVGWSVVFTGLVSAATLLKGFSGYYIDLFGGIDWVVITIALTLITLLAIIGVQQSVGFAVGITFLELFGLVLVVVASADTLREASQWQAWYEGLNVFSLSGLTAATFIAFYAFIGFEDMVNMAEEVKHAQYVLPKAIVIAIICAAILYGVISLVAVVVVNPTELAQSKAPLTLIVSQAAWFPLWLMSVISLIAIMNGAVVQLLMAPRVVYGITRQSTRLSWLSYIHPKTQTPITATVFVSIFILIFATSLPLAMLAKITSAIILSLFTLINSALVIVKRKEVTLGFQVPIWVPMVGAGLSLILLLLQFLIIEG